MDTLVNLYPAQASLISQAEMSTSNTVHKIDHLIRVISFGLTYVFWFIYTWIT